MILLLFRKIMLAGRKPMEQQIRDEMRVLPSIDPQFWKSHAVLSLLKIKQGCSMRH